MGKSKKIVLLLLCSLGIMELVTAQAVRCTPADRSSLAERLEMVRNIELEDPGSTLIEIGKSFLGMSYLAHSLESDGSEQLVVTFQGVDCTTFVENVLAFYQVRHQEDYSFDAFTKQLQLIRYRDGQINGYPSRLHYFTEWIANNTAKGLITDITRVLGGKEQAKKRNFMSRHRDAYTALAADSTFQEVLNMEADLEQDSYFVLDQNAITKAEPQLENGDIIAFATSIDGLDVTHTGFAIRQGERVHLLHASSSGEVEISDAPLAEYARGIRNNTGVIIARVKR